MSVALGIGVLVGCFLTLSSAWIMRRAIKLIAMDQAKWAMGDALGLASLWVSKFVGAGVALYFSIKAGYPAPWLAGGIPVGILVTIFLLKIQNKDDLK